MLIVGRSLIYIATSIPRERKRERQREKVRNSARGFFLREDLIPRPRGRASIILPVAVGALLRGNKYIEIRTIHFIKTKRKGEKGSGVKEEGDGERERGTGRKSTDEEFNERRV